MRTQEQSAGKRLETLRTRRKPLQRKEEAANRSKETREFVNEQTARKELGSFRTRSKPLENDWRF